YLYKTRWDIEKVFEEVKIKMGEKKAWATSETAKTMQAEFICMAHNLMLLFEQDIEKQGVKNNKEDERRKKRLTKDLGKCEVDTNKLPLFFTTTKRATQRPLKFIRWLRNHLFSNTSWLEAVASLKLIYDVF
ncbi:MAG: hypothetical protein GY874_08840, partial [Desulfobacteraceae bacterium]|nr:hypothetical protein [Desulfobacteraceae bacterium]